MDGLEHHLPIHQVHWEPEASSYFMNHQDQRSIMIEAELDAAYFSYETQNDDYFYRPKDFDRADQSLVGMFVVHEASMDAGLCFPLHSDGATS